jgi:CMP-N,N'-diacetyllegionaminic acid synthase
MLAIIPARGGSKGLPGKNIKPLAGKPLIGYSIEAAKNAKMVTRIIVSTDDVQIAEVAEQFGATVNLRPTHLAADDSLAIDTYLYVLEVERKAGNDHESIVVLLPTCPLRTAKDIDEAVLLFQEKSADSVVSYTEEYHPVTWHKYVADDLRFENVWNENQLKNRQDYKKTYFPNGSIYVFKSDLLKNKRYYSENSFAYLMPRNKSVDIDTLEDFKLAEYYLTHGV